MAELRFDVHRGDDVTATGCDLVIVPVLEGEQDSAAIRRLDRACPGLRGRVKEARFGGQDGRSLLHRAAGKPRLVFLAGLGKSAAVTEESWRRAGAAGVKAATGEGVERVAALVSGGGEDEAVAVAEGAALATYRFLRYRKPESEKRPRPKRLVLAGPKLGSKSLRERLRQVEAVVPTVFAARDLVNEPPSVKNASFLGRRAIELCKGTPVRVEVLNLAKIRQLRLNGLLAVNRGSTEEPRFIRMQYRPRGRKKARARVALVGKGITFDSGGLSLKPAGSMETMKQDMAGAAAVIATMAAVGRLRPDVEVTGYVPSTDNLPSGSAQKPGDVIRYRNGKTVEVLNTDAEGRLVLADALILACEARHDTVIDLATLTGACRIALGARVAAIMGNDDGLVNALALHGKGAGEAIWPLPLVREYRDDLRSTVADLKNVGGGLGGAITAGLFLEEFVDGAKWAHLDIAGPAFADKDWAYCPRGGTGFGVRTLVRYLLSL